MSDQIWDCLIVGAGQSGLMAAYELKKLNLNFIIVDKESRIGSAWRKRPEQLKLFTNRFYSGLADMKLAGDPQSYPTAQEFADYLENLAEKLEISIHTHHSVISLTKIDQLFKAQIKTPENKVQVVYSKTVINACGANQVIQVPAMAQLLDPEVLQISASDYKNSDSLKNCKNIVVVGDGASGRQIALELSQTHHVTLACGRKRKTLPKKILSQNLFWWLTKTGLLYLDKTSKIAKLMRRSDPIPNCELDHKNLTRQGIDLKPRLTATSKNKFTFQDKSEIHADAVIWCIGYKEDHSWIHWSTAMTHMPGYFLLGRPWQSCRASELILGAEKDSKLVIKKIEEVIHV